MSGLSGAVSSGAVSSGAVSSGSLRARPSSGKVLLKLRVRHPIVDSRLFIVFTGVVAEVLGNADALAGVAMMTDDAADTDAETNVDTDLADVVCLTADCGSATDTDVADVICGTADCGTAAL